MTIPFPTRTIYTYGPEAQASLREGAFKAAPICASEFDSLRKGGEFTLEMIRVDYRQHEDSFMGFFELSVLSRGCTSYKEAREKAYKAAKYYRESEFFDVHVFPFKNKDHWMFYDHLGDVIGFDIRDDLKRYIERQLRPLEVLPGSSSYHSEIPIRGTRVIGFSEDLT